MSTLFPLRLTPFEEYMLVDDQPAYPMSCFVLLKLHGQFDVSIFTSALRQALESHPLLTSLVAETKGKCYWHNTGTMPVVVRQPLDEERRFPAAKGIDLFHEPALKVTICNDNTDPAACTLAGQTHIVLEMHHSACDAVGIVRFIEDILCSYAQQTGFADAQREAVNLDLLARRSTFGQNRLRTLPKQLWGLTRAWMFLVNRVVPLTTLHNDDKRPFCSLRSLRESLRTLRLKFYRKGRNEFAKIATKPSAAYPAILYRDLTPSETQDVLQKVKQLGITINDFFLCSAFVAMKNWREQHQSSLLQHGLEFQRPLSLWERVRERGSIGNLRIAVPTNLRTADDVLMPAANVVSMVFLDRKPEKIQPVQAFYQGVHREMQHIKRCDLGWAFIHGLSLYRRIFGSFRKMMQPNRCWTTATVSNLGRLFADVPLPKREGRVQVDESLELIGVETSPPIRAGSALGISVQTYAGGMTVNLHYDADVLTRSDAQSILDDVSHASGRT
jgi:NRPS condensation-like uncharacterized protein